MVILLVGFDSAWTAGKRGAIVAVLRHEDGTFRELGDPCMVDFREATEAILAWQQDHAPDATTILIDQPTIVNNSTGQRPVEHIVCSCVSLRHGGMQPANTARADMFGEGAPVWAFLDRFGGAADPLFARPGEVTVIETYPVLAMIAMGWLMEDARVTGRLPKYNPERGKTFAIEEWRYVCRRLSSEFRDRNLFGTANWIDTVRDLDRPRKGDQDKLDACLCLLVALHLAEGRDCLMVGNVETGYIVVQHDPGLQRELEERCDVTGRDASEWVRKFTLFTKRQETEATVTRFERQVLAACLAGDDPQLKVLRRQADSVRVTDRKHTGNGARIEFSVNDIAPRLDAGDYVIDNIVLQVEHVPHGVATCLYVYDGCLQSLKFATYDDEWPKDPVIIGIDYTQAKAGMITAADIRNAYVSRLLIGYDWYGSEHFAELTLRQHGGIERTYRVEGLSSWSAFEDFRARHIEQCTLLTDPGSVYLCLDPFREGARSQKDNFWFVGSRILVDQAN